jgi:hypothetical protein
MASVVSAQEYEFELPGDLNIYRLRRPQISEETIRRVGGRFGLRATVEAGTFVHDARAIAYSQASAWGLRMFRRSAGWQYRDATRWQIDDGQGHLELDDDEAARIALETITGHEIASQPDVELARVQRLHVAHAQRAGANHSERIIGARVIYRRIVDGLAAEGPGGKTVVYLGHDRQLTGVDHLWHEVDGVHEPVAGLRSPAEALAELRRRYEDSDGRIEVSDIRLGYYELGWDAEQEFLQPAYVVYLQLLSPDERFRVNATAAFPAAVNAPGPVEPAPLPRPPQPARAS